jgi:hypothetical protein
VVHACNPSRSGGGDQEPQGRPRHKVSETLLQLTWWHNARHPNYTGGIGKRLVVQGLSEKN